MELKCLTSIKKKQASAIKRALRGSMIAWLIALLVSGPCAALAQNKYWTTVASAGTVDEADASIVRFSSNYAEVSAAAGTVHLRYNVVPVDGLFGLGFTGLKVRFRDDGANAQVIVRLKKLNLATGLTSTLLTFDSNSFGAGAAGWRTELRTDCAAINFDFFTHAYYLEAQIIKGAGGNPGLGAIQIIDDVVC